MEATWAAECGECVMRNFYGFWAIVDRIYCSGGAAPAYNRYPSGYGGAAYGRGGGGGYGGMPAPAVGYGYPGPAPISQPGMGYYGGAAMGAPAGGFAGYGAAGGAQVGVGAQVSGYGGAAQYSPSAGRPVPGDEFSGAGAGRDYQQSAPQGVLAPSLAVVLGTSSLFSLWYQVTIAARLLPAMPMRRRCRCVLSSSNSSSIRTAARPWLLGATAAAPTECMELRAARRQWPRTQRASACLQGGLRTPPCSSNSSSRTATTPTSRATTGRTGARGRRRAERTAATDRTRRGARRTTVMVRSSEASSQIIVSGAFRSCGVSCLTDTLWAKLLLIKLSK